LPATRDWESGLARLTNNHSRLLNARREYGTRHSSHLQQTRRVVTKHLDQPQGRLGRLAMALFPALDGLGRDVEQSGVDGLRHAAGESEPRQFRGADLRRPVRHFEGRGLQSDLALGVADRFFQALADPFRDWEPLPLVFHVRSRLPRSATLVLENPD